MLHCDHNKESSFHRNSSSRFHSVIQSAYRLYFLMIWTGSKNTHDAQQFHWNWREHLEIHSTDLDMTFFYYSDVNLMEKLNSNNGLSSHLFIRQQWRIWISLGRELQKSFFNNRCTLLAGSVQKIHHKFNCNTLHVENINTNFIVFNSSSLADFLIAILGWKLWTCTKFWFHTMTTFVKLNIKHINTNLWQKLS